MANALLTIDMVSFETLDELDNAPVLGNLSIREYDERFGVDGAKIGDSYSVRKPQKYIVQSGEAMGAVQDLQDDQVTIQIEHQDHIPIMFGQRERKLSIDDYRRRYIKPQATALTNKVDTRGYALYKGIYNHSGVVSAVPNDSVTYTDGLVRIANGGTPMDDQLSVCVSHRMEKTLVNAEKALFHATRAIERGYITGEMGEAHGAMWYATNNTPIHTNGILGGAGAVVGANQTGSSLLTNTWTASISPLLRKGDCFTLPAVFAVHPQTYQSTGELQQFVVTADVASDGAGAATIPIAPSIITSGPLQTVTASPANAAALTVTGTTAANSRQGLLFHNGWGALTIVDLPRPMGGAEFAPVRSKKYRMAFQMVADFDIRTYQNVVRTDILYGWTLFWPEYAHRIYSQS